MIDTFDYIVVGGGSAGCIVAAELAKESRVLLLEAGPTAEEHPETLVASGYKEAFINNAVMGERFTVPQDHAAKQSRPTGPAGIPAQGSAAGQDTWAARPAFHRH